MIDKRKEVKKEELEKNKIWDTSLEIRHEKEELSAE